MYNYQVYACKNKDVTERIISSSGGVYILFAKEIIRKGGSVFAACYNGLEVEHRELCDLNIIYESCGAKYVASNLANCYKIIDERIKAREYVLFVGTPCECAYLQTRYKENDYFLCIDIVCHGVPNVRYWRLYLDSLSKEGINVSALNMRSKITGWSRFKYSWEIYTEEGKTLYQKQSENLYMAAFLNNLILNQNCYRCRYKELIRPGDISIGDFWGIWDIMSDFDDNKGVSLVFINSSKGNYFFQSISDKIDMRTVDNKEYLRYNEGLNKIAKKPEYYDEFHERLDAGEDFQELVAEYTGLKKSGKNSFLTIYQFIPTILKLKLKYYYERFIH